MSIAGFTMSSIDFDKIVYHSGFHGLANYGSQSLSVDCGGVTLDGTASPSDDRSYSTSVGLNRSYATANHIVRLAGINPSWYNISANIDNYYNGTTRLTTTVLAKYGVAIYVYTSSNTLYLDVFLYTLDPADVSISVPSFTVELKTKLMLPPFESVL